MQQLQLTREQQECVVYRGSRDFLISGVPGSGKTNVLLLRGSLFARELWHSTSSVAIFTYNKPLANHARQQIALNADDTHIIVTNFHRWAWGHLEARVRRSPLRAHERRIILGRVLDEVRARNAAPSSILNKSLDWWSDELQWIKGRAIFDHAEYESTRRRGRMTGLLKTRRTDVWEVYEAYQAELKRLRRIEYDDYALEILRSFELVPDHEMFDHVLVDEAQDLSFAEMKVLSLVARQSLTVVLDLGQKIYKKTYAWNELGIEVVGRRSRRLTKSFRSTRQIAALAASLRRHDTSLPQEELASELPDREGPLPMLRAAQDVAQQEALLLQLIRALVREHPDKSIALLARAWEPLHRVQSLLAPDITCESIHDHEGIASTSGVKLTTFHSSKGLEFDIVILMSLDDGIIPQHPVDLRPEMPEDEREDAEEHMNHERRLLYVSMTRAKHALYMTHTQPPSRFLAELDPSLYTRSAQDL